MNIDAVLKGIEDADPTAGAAANDKITVRGQHVVEVQHVKIKESEQYSAVYLIVEYRVHATNAEDKGIRPGDAYSWTHDLTDKWYGLSNAKQFIAAALGLSPSSEEARGIGKAEILEAIGEDQPLAGQMVRLSTMPKSTKSGRAFTVHDWAPAAE